MQIFPDAAAAERHLRQERNRIAQHHGHVPRIDEVQEDRYARNHQLDINETRQEHYAHLTRVQLEIAAATIHLDREVLREANTAVVLEKGRAVAVWKDRAEQSQAAETAAKKEIVELKREVEILRARVAPRELDKENERLRAELRGAEDALGRRKFAHQPFPTRTRSKADK